VATALVTDWRNMTEPDGTAIACTEANVRQIVTELPRLRQQILAYAESLENYRPDKVAAGAGCRWQASALGPTE
jgi:hypothetical protein